MSYTPDSLVITPWDTTFYISGGDRIADLDEEVTDIINGRARADSLINWVNAELAKLPGYLDSEMVKIYNEAVNQTSDYADKAQAWAEGHEPGGVGTKSAKESANDAQLRAWEAEADEKTANSYAVEPKDVHTKIYTSNGDGTFSHTDTSDYSALHYSLKTDATNKVSKSGDTMTGNLEAPSLSIDGKMISPYSMRNRLINGDFDIRQRGIDIDTSDGHSKYVVDRWFLDVTTVVVGDNLYIYTSQPEEDAIRLDYTLNDDHGVALTQQIEGTDLMGKEVTISFYVRYKGLNSSSQGVVNTINVEMTSHKNGGTNTHTHVGIEVPDDGNTWKRVELTMVVPDVAATGSETITDYVDFKLVQSKRMSGHIYMDFKNVQLELGKYATPFEYRPKAIELMMCQRYYYKDTKGRTLMLFSSNTNTRRLELNHPVHMRAEPEITGTSSIGTPSFASKDAHGFRCSVAGSDTTTTISLNEYEVSAEYR